MQVVSSHCIRPTLQTLPHELILKIIESVDSKDLISLRLTCRDVSACTLVRFSKVHFSERRHILTRHSLQALIDITAHPVYGKDVRSISLGSSRLCESPHLSFALLLGSLNDPRVQSRLVKFRGDALVVVSEQAQLEQTKEGSKLLATALDNNHKRGNAATLGMWVDVVAGESAARDPRYFRNPDYEDRLYFSGWGSRRSYGSDIGASEMAQHIYFEEKATSTMHVLLEAIGNTDCAIQNLSLSIYNFDRTLMLGRHAEIPRAVRREKIYPKLQRVHIFRSAHAEPQYPMFRSRTMDPDTMTSLVRLLTLAQPKKLKTCTPLPKIHLWLPRTHLTELHIVRFEGRLQDLADSLDQSAQRSNHLRLSEAAFEATTVSRIALYGCTTS